MIRQTGLIVLNVRRRLKLCNYCNQEVGGKGTEDTWVDWCYECDMCVEGDTHDGEDERDFIETD